MISKCTLVTSIVAILVSAGLAEAAGRGGGMMGMMGGGKGGGMMGGGMMNCGKGGSMMGGGMMNCCKGGGMMGGGMMGGGMMGGGTPGLTSIPQLQLYQAMLQLQASQVALRQQLLSAPPTTMIKQPMTTKETSPEPLQKRITRETPTLVRSVEEQEQRAQQAFDRGLKAEQEGKLQLAEIIYYNTSSIYPNAAIATQARAALDRLEENRAKQIEEDR